MISVMVSVVMMNLVALSLSNNDKNLGEFLNWLMLSQNISNEKFCLKSCDTMNLSKIFLMVVNCKTIFVQAIVYNNEITLLIDIYFYE
jgi:hypothetical protein